MQGYRDTKGRLTGKFGPANPVTRAEFLKMIAVMMTKRYDFDRSWIPTGEHWYETYLNIVQSKDSALQEVMPIEDTALRSPILRHEAAGLVYLGLGMHHNIQTWDTMQLFPDTDRDMSNAFAVTALRSFGILDGDGGTGLFYPYRTLNRAEAAKILVVTAGIFQIPLGSAGTAVSSPPSQENPVTQEGCEQRGGIWRQWGRLPQESCNMPAPDAGTPCTDSAECQGGCIGENEQATSGRCGEWQDVYGCNVFMHSGKTYGTLCAE